MFFTASYPSLLGHLTLVSDGDSLVGLWFNAQRHLNHALLDKSKEQNVPVFEEIKKWLDIYFQGKDPGPLPPVRFYGTEFRKAVWALLTKIPYGQTITYKDLALQIARLNGCARMSAQAIGGAVGHNPIGIIVPCHRVIGSDGSLTGYAGGISLKEALLRLEGALK